MANKGVNQIRSDEHVIMTLPSVTVSRHQGIGTSIVRGISFVSAVKGETYNVAAAHPGASREAVYREATHNVRSKQPQTEFRFKSIEVTENRILGPNGAPLNTPFMRNFIVFAPEFSDVLIEDFRKTGVAEMANALEAIENSNGFFSRISKPFKRSKILTGSDPRFPITWEQLQDVEVKTSGFPFKHDYLCITVTSVLNSAFVDFARTAKGSSNMQLNSEEKRHRDPSKTKRVIDIKPKSDANIRPLAEMLRGKLGLPTEAAAAAASH